MLLNLKRMREEMFFSRVAAIAGLLDTNPPFPEQDALNLACDGSWLELHPKWNAYASLYFHGDAGTNTWPRLTLNEAVTSPAILHFESPIIFRPWSVRCIHPHRELYRWYRNRTPWPLPAPESSGFKDRIYSFLPVPLRLSLLRRRVRFTRRRQSPPAANPGRRSGLTLRQSAKRSLAMVFGWLQRFGVDLLPRHFYSSIPGIRQLRSEPRWRAPRTFVGVEGSDVAEQLRVPALASQPRCGAPTSQRRRVPRCVLRERRAGLRPGRGRRPVRVRPLAASEQDRPGRRGCVDSRDPRGRARSTLHARRSWPWTLTRPRFFAARP